MPAGRPTTKSAPPFGQQLALLRKSRGWTQPELAEKIGMAVKTIAYYEREANNPTTKTIKRFAEAFDIEPTELIEAARGNVMPKKPGPTPKMQQLFERLSQLPKGQQKVVEQMLEGFLNEAQKKVS